MTYSSIVSYVEPTLINSVGRNAEVGLMWIIIANVNMCN